MTKREKTLGVAFGSLFVVLVGGFGGTVAFKNIGEMRAQTARLEERAVALQSVIEARALWEQRSEWINQSAPVFSTPGQAATDLIAHIDQVSGKIGVTVDSKELVNKGEESDENAENQGGFFDSASINVRVHGNDQAVLSWIHGLQQPTKFTGVDSVKLETGDSGLECEARVRLWYSSE